MAQTTRILSFRYTLSILLIIILNAMLCCYPTTGVLLQNDSESIDKVTKHAQHDAALGNVSSQMGRCQKIYGNLTSQQIARFVDASGKLGSGIYGGNTLWYGSYSECQKLPDSRYCWTIFPGNIFLLENNSQVSHIEWGVCVPDVCTSEDVLKNFNFFFKNVSGIEQVTPFTKFLHVECAEDPEYTSSVVITIIFCGLLVFICLLATIMEISRKPIKAETIENAAHISMDEDVNEKSPLLSDVTPKIEKNDGLCCQILHSFSMIRNIKSIMSTDCGKSDLTYLHGIRVLSLFWIILFHVNGAFILSFGPFDNLKDVIHSNRRLLQIVLNTAYGVDTFFVLSGLLVMYTNMSKKVKNNGQTNWFKYYFHRFWRLTPSYMFVILLVAKLRPFFGAGPLWFVEADTSACSEHWWTNLLYLNNFLKMGDKSSGMCMIQTWYLAADMQMFLVSPIFLFIAYRYKLRPLACLAGLTILASIIVTACLAANDDVLPLNGSYLRLNTFFGDAQEDYFSRDNYFKGFEDIYVKPYCRIQPYAMGMVLGYLLYTYFSKDLKLQWKFVAAVWIAAIALALTVVYAPYSSIKEDPHVWTTGERALFWSLKWSIWGLCIVWLIFACHYNYAGLVKNILAAKFWIPLSRINYAAYLIHLDVMKVFFFNLETSIHYTSFTTVTMFLSSLMLTYSIAFIIAVVVEFPFANLEALAWKAWEKK